jgi:type VI secretion system protein ImpA
MINAEDLLKPISPDKPCGPDLGYDPAFDELETLLKGKPEVEIGQVKRPAEPPDWKALEEKSAAFLKRSKHLRVAVILTGSLVKTSGFEGFRQGLSLVKGLVEQNWAAMYPLLDPEDNNDPTQRLNLLGALTAPRGSVTGWLTIVDNLYGAPVCRPKGMPPVTFDDIIAAKLRAAGGDGAPANAPDPVKLASAIRDGGTEQLTATQKALTASLEMIQGLDQFLTSTLGAGGTINFESLQKALNEMVSGLKSYLDGDGAAAGEMTAAAEGGAAPGAGGGASIQISGSVRSRNDVVRMIDAICGYYDQVEPSSPVPLLLKRARILAKMGFVEAMQELNLATIDTLKTIGGSAVETPPPPPETPPASA